MFWSRTIWIGPTDIIFGVNIHSEKCYMSQCPDISWKPNFGPKFSTPRFFLLRLFSTKTLLKKYLQDELSKQMTRLLLSAMIMTGNVPHLARTSPIWLLEKWILEVWPECADNLELNTKNSNKRVSSPSMRSRRWTGRRGQNNIWVMTDWTSTFTLNVL